MASERAALAVVALGGTGSRLAGIQGAADRRLVHADTTWRVLHQLRRSLLHPPRTVTASIYAHLFGNELAQVSDALDRLAERELGSVDGQNGATKPESGPEETT